MQYPNVSSHVCHQPAQAPPEAARYVQYMEQRSQMLLSLPCEPLSLKRFLPSSLPYAVGVGPASVVLGNLVAGKRIAQAAGRDLGMIEDQDLVRKVTHRDQLFIPYFTKTSTSLTARCKRLICRFKNPDAPANFSFIISNML